MPRTTVDLEVPILDELRTLSRREGRSLGKVISALVAEALAHRRAGTARRPLEWVAKPLGARLDVADKAALLAVLEQEDRDRLAGHGTDGAGGE